MSILNLEEPIIGARTTAHSAGTTLKSGLEPAKGKKRAAIIAAIKTVVDKGKKGVMDGKGGCSGKKY